MSDKIIETNDTNFENDVLNAKKTTLVDFWAPWCRPCLLLAPTLEEVSQLREDQINIVKVNVDECPEIAKQYKVMGIPTLMLFNGKEVVAQSSGNLPLENVLTFIDDNIKSQS